MLTNSRYGGRIMSLIKIIDDVISLSAQIIKKDEEIIKKHGLKLGISLNDPKSDAYRKEVSSLRDDLKEYLNSLSTEQVGMIETIMYFGRDPEDVHGNDIKEYHSRLHSNGIDKKGSIRNICEKSLALETYLNSAKTKAAQLKLDLDSFV